MREVINLGVLGHVLVIGLPGDLWAVLQVSLVQGRGLSWEQHGSGQRDT